MASCVGPVSLPRPGSGFRSGGRISMAHFTAFSLHRPPRTRTSAASLTLTELARVCCCVRPPGRPRPRRLDVDLSHGRLTFNDIRNRRRRLVPRRAGRVARSARVNPMHPPTGPKRHAPMHAPPSRPRAPQPRTGRVFRGVFYTIHRPHRAPREGEGAGLANGDLSPAALAPHARSVYRTSVLSLIAPVPRYASSTNQLQCAYPCAMPHI